MQLVNDDMDELFRRAGEEYPLKTDGADWNKVMQGMHHKEDDLPKQKNKSFNPKYLLLLLLLPLGVICGKFINDDSATGKINKETPQTTPINNAGTAKKDSKETGKRSAETTSSAAGKSTVKTTLPAIANGSADTKNKIGNKGNRTGINALHGNSGAQKVAGPNTNKIINRTIAQAKNTAPTSASSQAGINNSVPVTDGKKLSGDERIPVKAPSPQTPSVGKTSVVADLKNPPSKPDSTAVAGIHKTTSTEVRKDSGLANNQSAVKKQKDKKLYYSLTAGPEVSTVKYQKPSNVGYSVGLLLGYQFNKRVSVEAGALLSHKTYYTKGSYLDTSRLKIPMHSMVSDATGSCNMIEIPINIKYTLITNARHSWFISGGLSTYLMLKESYNLTYTRYNQPYVEDYKYDNASKDYLSILNVSAGYQKSLGKSARVSIAPYIKLPLGNVGIGKLPITSTGVYVSFTGFIY